ncbi:uncharacterized protein [Coffea arabica]|uniref:CCHC-type domain-containing protein n=1 Tax=Coffea arabica TaxID=13443 RepID=A0A6P6XKT7_COFAR|nr:uncharacterized protein LOC113743952 [Coffea arabica]
MARFLNGLRPDIAERVELQHYIELHELVDKAIKVEQRLKRRGTTRSNFGNTTYSTNHPFEPRKDSRLSPNAPTPKPRFEGGKVGNSSVGKPPFSTPKFEEPRVQTRARDTRCFKCQGRGHIASQCPNQRTMIMIKNGEILSEDEAEYEGMPPLEGGSDVPIQASHIILGRPWQFDRQKYEKYCTKKKENVSVEAKGERKKAIDSSASEVKSERKRMLLIKAKKVRKLMRDEQSLLMLVSKEVALNVHELDTDIPLEVKSLLQEYADVFPEDMPSGLPPLRGIEYQIDFIPGASLPNRPTYKSNPEETKELQRQVDELLGKGWTHESLNPCAIPIILVPKKDGTWRMCTDYRVVNAITVKYRHPISRLDDMFDELHGAVFFTKIDLKSIGFGAMLNQGERPIAYFSEKLNGAALNYSTYDKELYALIRALQVWQHYLRPKEFVIHTDHESLKYLKAQHNLSKKHARWIAFVESFPYVIKYKAGKSNVVADALSRRYSLITSLDAKLLGFELIKELYAQDSDFGELTFLTNTPGKEHFYWPHMRRDIARVVE